jgi:hypothetical protein
MNINFIVRSQILQGKKAEKPINWPTPWSRVLPKMLVVAQIVKKTSSFMEPEGSLPYSQEFAPGLYPDAYESSPRNDILFI